MGCMAISCTLLGSLRLESVAQDIRSTCSKMEADDSCSFVPFKGGGPEVGGKELETQHSEVDANIYLNQGREHSTLDCHDYK